MTHRRTFELPSVTDRTIAIDRPTMFQPYAAVPGIDVLPAYLPVPGMGVLPANAFLLRGAEPMLVDTGPGGVSDEFVAALGSLIDPAELRWVWLTHTDPDHVGALRQLLVAAPRARVVTTYLAVGKLGMHLPVPLDRVHLCNPGETLRVGDRTLVARRPPTFDAPETTAVFDAESGTLFSADTFGALMSSPAATASEIPAADVEEGMVLWTAIDSPWLHQVRRSAFDAAVADIAALEPRRILSAHLPPAEGMARRLLDCLRLVPDTRPWVGPDQAMLTRMLASA